MDPAAREEGREIDLGFGNCPEGRLITRRLASKSKSVSPKETATKKEPFPNTKHEPPRV